MNKLIYFIAESFARWGNRSPRYMRVWKWANWIISGLAFLPLILDYFEVVTTGGVAKLVLACVSFSTLYGSAMNTLVVSKPEDIALPFTEKKQ